MLSCKRNTGGMGFCVLLSALALLLSGCVVRTYSLTRDRVDQDLSDSTGNRGYLMGSAPVGEVEAERPTTRTTQVVEIELHSPIKFDRMGKKGNKKVSETTDAQLSTDLTSTADDSSAFTTSGGSQSTYVSSDVSSQQYTVQEGDTLQKISSKFYGTTKKWMKIFDANKNKLKTPDRVRPGQVLDIPDVAGSVIGESSLQEPAGNLK
ncbi:MAG: LysM peptidoglycan-binding domain-containing protein [Candidatus Omnitrophota bacterium]|nr:LysM peptidoglycan-binding domain-containing protein [Candidatus Omnitrophota bacterium]